MGKYSKAIGAIVGGLLGAAAVALGLTDAEGVVNPAFVPAIDALVATVMASLGSYFAPKNAE